MTNSPTTEGGTKRKRRFRWKPLRISVQIIAFAAFVVYFAGIVYPLAAPWRYDLLFQLDPLTHLYLLVSGNGLPHWGFALVSLGLVFIISRIFCGWLCPLGAMLDLVSGIRGRLKLINAWRKGKAHRPHLKNRQGSFLPANFDLYLLVSLLVLAALGLPLIWLLDPIVFSFKLMTTLVQPVADLPVREAFFVLDDKYYLESWWRPVSGAFNTLLDPERAPLYINTGLFFALAALIFGLEFWQRRFWCRYLCPLGALNRLSYKLHPLKRRFNPDCAHCLACEKACHFGGTSEEDCIYCMECIDSCQHGTLSFLPKKDTKQYTGQTERKQPPREPQTAYFNRLTGETRNTGISRRLLLQYGAAGLLVAPLLKLGDSLSELPADLIRPPGVGDDEARFNELCIKCGQCLKVCPTGGLQPTALEAGLSSIWTPRLIMRIGECTHTCNQCGNVCPSGAIPKLNLVKKQEYKLGVAYIEKSSCIPFDTPYNCVVCEEHCPTADKAIKMTGRVRQDKLGNDYELLRPSVDTDLCNGCGICERVCPVAGSAIRVLRLPTGGYGTEVLIDEYESSFLDERMS